MPPLESSVLAILTSVATIMAQLIKGLLPEKVKQYLPLILAVLLVPIGTLLAYAYGRDPIAGALEGLFAFGSAVGFYEAASKVPVAKQVFTSEGWITRGSQDEQ